MKKTKKAAPDKNETNSAITTRFMQLMGELIMLHKRTNGPYRNVTKFAKSIGANPTNFSQYDMTKNGRSVTLKMCADFCRIHGANANWLLLGTGEKYMNKDVNNKTASVEERLARIEAKLNTPAKAKK